jgi:exopolysaccharide production protein ExoZ
MPFPPETSYPVPLLRDHGWIAVNFFFAVSGFVVCLVAAKPNFRPLQFLVRRAFRLYPLWIATSLVFLVVAMIALGMPERHSPAFFAYSLTLLPTDGFPFYDLGWTLQHELAFYALAALLLPSFGVLGLSAFLCAAAVADHVFTLPWYLHQYASYYPNFLAGVAAFAANRYVKPFGFWIPFAAGIGLLVLFTELNGRVAYPVALFFLLAGFINIEVDDKSPAQKAGVLLGDASYSIYLIHPLVFYCVYWKLQPPLPPIWSQEFLRFGSIAVVCLLAIASWKLFESPMIRDRKPADKKIQEFGNREPSENGGVTTTLTHIINDPIVGLSASVLDFASYLAERGAHTRSPSL